MKNRTEFTIEIDEVTMVSYRKSSNAASCAQQADEASMEFSEDQLIQLNAVIAEMELRRDGEARKFFEALLSDELLFRRASGVVVGKSANKTFRTAPLGFLEGLDEPGRFTSLRVEDLRVSALDDRALVTLIVAGTRPDNSIGRYRNIRLFSRSGENWLLEFWYNYELLSTSEV